MQIIDFKIYRLSVNDLTIYINSPFNLTPLNQSYSLFLSWSMVSGQDLAQGSLTVKTLKDNRKKHKKVA